MNSMDVHVNQVARNDLNDSAFQMRPSLENVRTVLFDLDDTLIDTLNTSYAVVSATALQYGLPVPTFEEYRRPYGGSFPHLVNAWFPGLGVDATEFRSDFEKNGLSVETPTLFDVHTVVSTLRAAGLSVGIVTNSGSERAKLKLANAKLSNEALDCIITHNDTNGVLKPSPEGLLLAMKRLNITDPTSVLYVGNAYEDQLAAHAAQMNFCAINQAENWSERLSPKSYFLESAAGIPSLLKL